MRDVNDFPLWSTGHISHRTTSAASSRLEARVPRGMGDFFTPSKSLLLTPNTWDNLKGVNYELRKNL